MTYEEKMKFVHSLVDSCRAAILKSVPAMPEDWDGIELRWFIAREFERQAAFAKTCSGSRKRYRNFLNTVATTPL
jgi:hypothetical protein